MRVTGYIVGLTNPNFSGLATVQIASRKNARKTHNPGKLTVLYCEAGFGVRQIVNYFGSWGSLVDRGPLTKLTLEVDDTNGVLIAGIVEG
jgi:hypothetical protein